MIIMAKTPKQINIYGNNMHKVEVKLAVKC
jgi:hypothetical protein